MYLFQFSSFQKTCKSPAVRIKHLNNNIASLPAETRGRPGRSQRYAYAYLVAYALSMTESIPNPLSHLDAIANEKSAQWSVAMQEKIESLKKTRLEIWSNCRKGEKSSFASVFKKKSKDKQAGFKA